MGVYAAMSGAGSAIGLLLGGALTDIASWRWVFFWLLTSRLTSRVRDAERDQ
jgi:MFS family permease